MDFFLFLALNAVLFARPSELVPALAEVPVYEIVILTCLAASLPGVLRQFSPRALASQPVTVCVLGVLGGIVLSQLSRLYIGMAWQEGFSFAKVVVYYLLLMATVNTPARLKRYMGALVCFATALATIALLQYHEIVTIPGLTTLQQLEIDGLTGDIITIPRLRGTGIFNDPNDLSLMLVAGVLLSLYAAGDKRRGPGRFGWLAPLPLFLYALTLTQSRGGFLSLTCGLFVLFRARYGWLKAAALASVVLPAVFLLFSGRQTDISLEGGTSQERIQAWRDGFQLFKGSPVFGNGSGTFADEVGIVAHNSFVHCYAELGLVGGTFFTGLFFCAGLGLWRMCSPRAPKFDPEMARAAQYALAILGAYAVGLLSLSRPYVASTYSVVGLAAALLTVADVRFKRPVLMTNFRLLPRLVTASGAWLVCLYVFVRFFAR